MRIAFVSPEYVTESNFDGGLANYLGRVCPALVAMGHEIVLFVASDRDEVVDDRGVEVRRVRMRQTLPKWINRLTLWRLSRSVAWLLQSYLLNRALRSVHRDAPFALVQYASYTATAFFRPKALPTVVRISSFQPLIQAAYDVPLTLDVRLMAWLDRMAIGKADRAFGPSHLIAEVVKRSVGKSIEVIESPFVQDVGLDDEQLYQDQLDGKDYLLFFGTLGRLKGVAVIAEILRPLLEKHPDLLFVLVGKDGGYGNGTMMDHVREMAGPVQGRVIWLGKLKKQQLNPVLRRAKVVVLPSLIDNLPNTCIEAMAMQRVVIGTYGASFEQLIDGGISGLLCELDSPEQLRLAIERALSLSSEKRDEIGQRAALRIEKLKPEIVIQQLVDFYSSVGTR